MQASLAILLIGLVGGWVSAAELNPSILLHQYHQVPDGVQSVGRAAALGCQHVNVVVTMFCDIDQQHQVQGYGVIQRGQYTPLTERARSEFRDSLQKVFAAVVAQEMDLSVLAHLDAAGEIYAWRNEFQFDPLRQYRGYSYQEALIAPILEALAAAVPPDSRVDFALTGEMGRSVFAHPRAYAELLAEIRHEKRFPQLQIGLSFNFSHVSGGHQPSAAERREVQQLVEACDFIGLSNYRPFDLPLGPQEFSRTVTEFLHEMRAHGASLPATMPLQFSEVGLGGGTEKGPAKTPTAAAKTPWEGTVNPRENPWSSPSMRALRVEFHRALLQFLARQGGGAIGQLPPGEDWPTAGGSWDSPAQQKLSPPLPQHPVTEAFLWSEGSWDPLDIIDPGFADPQIIQLIQQHNARVRSP